MRTFEEYKAIAIRGNDLEMVEVMRELVDIKEKLLEALEPFAAFACSPPGECECHNCRARDVFIKAKGE